jgi:hypothetical protein
VIPSGKTLTLINPSRSQSSDVVIDAQSASRVMHIEQGAVVTLERLTIQHGRSVSMKAAESSTREL